jgi:hypothetical protein
MSPRTYQRILEALALGALAFAAITAVLVVLWMLE